MEDQENIEDILVEGLSHILKRTLKLNHRDQLAITQEYKEWINRIASNDFTKQEILIIDEYTLEKFFHQT